MKCKQRLLRFYLLFLLALVFLVGISFGANAQPSLSDSLSSLKKILSEAESLSSAQMQRLLRLEKDNERLRQLSIEQEESLQTLSGMHSQLMTSYMRQSQLLRDLRLSHETEISDLEARLLRRTLWMSLAGVGISSTAYALGGGFQ